MITPEKIRSIKRQLKRGEPEGEIKETLRKEGYSEEDITLLFKPHHYDMRSWYLTFAILFAVTGLYLLITKSSFLVLIFSAFLFFYWYYEINRLKKLKNLK